MNNSDLEQNIKCFIFSDNLDQVEKFFNSENQEFNCKVLNLNSEMRNLRRDLSSKHSVDISRIDMLDYNEAFIIARNYDDLQGIPETTVNGESRVIVNLKRELLLLGMFTMAKLNREVPTMQNKRSANYRKKSKTLKMLKELFSNNFGKFL